MSSDLEQMPLFSFPYACTDPVEEDGLIHPVIACTRSLLSLPHATPATLVGLARAIHALERLPHPTKGVDVEYAFGFRCGSDDDFEETLQVVQITPDSICFSTLSRTWNSKTGGDHNTTVSFEMDAGGNLVHMDDDAWGIAFAWAEGLDHVLANNPPASLRLDVSDNSDPSLLSGGES